MTSCASKHVWIKADYQIGQLSLLTNKGETITIPSSSGRYVLLLYWSIAEPLSRQIGKEFENVYQSLKSQNNITVVAVNSGWNLNKEQINRYYQESGLLFPYLIDHDKIVMEKLKSGSTPQTLIIDSKGNVETILFGYRDDINYLDEVTKKLKSLN